MTEQDLEFLRGKSLSAIKRLQIISWLTTAAKLTASIALGVVLMLMIYKVW